MVRIFRYLLITLCFLFILTACGTQENSSSAPISGMQSVDDILSEQMALEDGDVTQEAQQPQGTSPQIEKQDNATQASDVDIDLTQLSETIAYAEMYSMVTTPLAYHGKTVKLTGYYDEYHDVMTDTLYASVFVLDTLACCAQGMDIRFSDVYLYPSDYPTDGDEITVMATFEIYYPNPESLDFYGHLVDAVIVS